VIVSRFAQGWHYQRCCCCFQSWQSRNHHFDHVPSNLMMLEKMISVGAMAVEKLSKN
jgi:hypothetical protein